MKRSCDQMDIAENNLPENFERSVAKRPKDNSDTRELPINDAQFQDMRNFLQFGQYNLVERDSNPCGQPLVNSEYVGKSTYQEGMDLDASTSKVSEFVAGNLNNKVNIIGQNMKYLHDSLQKAFQDAQQDSALHSAACNFVKKPGNMYHLYERPSGQKYFSMLSPEDWGGNTPHHFMGSWYLHADQSWSKAEEMHTRFEGIQFLKNFCSPKLQYFKELK